MSDPEKPEARCQARVWSPDGRGSCWDCSRKAVIHEKEKISGKTVWHCTQHSSAAQSKRDAKQKARWDAKSSADKRGYARSDARTALMNWARSPEARLFLPRAALEIVEKYEANL